MFRNTVGPDRPASVTAWAPWTNYKAGEVVTYRGVPFIAPADVVGVATFVFASWLALPGGNPLPPHTFDPKYTGLNFGAQSANRVNFGRVYGAPMLISKLGINIGVSSGNVSLAVYSSTGVGSQARPGTRLATTGSVACPAAGEASISLDAPVVVVPGDWFALSCDNGTATFFRATTASMNFALSGYVQQTSAHPAPATAGTLGAAASMFYVVGVE